MRAKYDTVSIEALPAEDVELPRGGMRRNAGDGISVE